jgi:transcriptional regulator with XRE-family HTH domain
MGMPIRTTAVEAATARGMSKKELAQRTGLALSTIYNLESGKRPSAKAISAIMQVFADLPFERLFVVGDSNKLEGSISTREPRNAASRAG